MNGTAAGAAVGRGGTLSACPPGSELREYAQQRRHDHRSAEEDTAADPANQGNQNLSMQAHQCGDPTYHVKTRTVSSRAGMNR